SLRSASCLHRCVTSTGFSGLQRANGNSHAPWRRCGPCGGGRRQRSPGGETRDKDDSRNRFRYHLIVIGPGSEVGPYAVLDVLGEGGMATVYLADDAKHGRRVAIKVMRPDAVAAIGPERFGREIETIARLSHPHILPLYDSGSADGQLFFVMPLIAGPSLR